MIAQHEAHQLLGHSDFSGDPCSRPLLPIERRAEIRSGNVSSVHVDDYTASSDTMQYPSDEMSTDAFSGWLAERMERKGWSQSALAAASGIHKANISAWLRGRNRPTPDQIRPLAESLDASIEEAFRVLGWFDKPTALTPAQADLIETIRRRNIDDAVANTAREMIVNMDNAMKQHGEPRE